MRQIDNTRHQMKCGTNTCFIQAFAALRSLMPTRLTSSRPSHRRGIGRRHPCLSTSCRLLRVARCNVAQTVCERRISSSAKRLQSATSLILAHFIADSLDVVVRLPFTLSYTLSYTPLVHSLIHSSHTHSYALSYALPFTLSCNL